MTPEGKVKQRVKQILDALGILWFMPGAVWGRAGISDFIGLTPNGRFVAIECKADPTCKPTVAQRVFLEDVAANGGFAKLIHCDNLGELQEELFFLCSLRLLNS